jgi:hypothetical protein
MRTRHEPRSLRPLLHGDFRVFKDAGEYLWLAFPKPSKVALMRFFIEPRCGFDY